MTVDIGSRIYEERRAWDRNWQRDFRIWSECLIRTEKIGLLKADGLSVTPDALVGGCKRVVRDIAIEVELDVLRRRIRCRIGVAIAIFAGDRRHLKIEVRGLISG